MEVLLSNGQKVLVNVLTSDQTEDVLEVRHLYCTAPPPLHLRGPGFGVTGTSQYDELYFLPYSQAVSAKLDLPDDLIGYFSLFLVREKEDGTFSCEFRGLDYFPVHLVVNLPPNPSQNVTFP